MDPKEVRPRWFYGPGGKSKIFEKGEDPPKGWETHSSLVKEPVEKPQSAGRGSKKKEPELTPEQAAAAAEKKEQEYRAEVIGFLRAEGVEFDENAPIEELEEKMNAVPEAEG